MEKARDVFDRLRDHLSAMDLLPDGYFMFKEDEFISEPTLPEGCRATCTVDWGQFDGIYMNISVTGIGKNGDVCTVPFATGKTRASDADAYYRMFRIAAECSLMLNGEGHEYNHNNVEMVLDIRDARNLLENCQADIDELDLTADIKQSLQSVCDLLRKQIENPTFQHTPSIVVHQ